MKLATKTLSTLILIFCFLFSYSQQGNNWYFGWFAGLNFNTTPPTALTDGNLITEEGCSVISNKNGSLLFYCDGVTVHNRNHTVMPNGSGLMGNTSSTQAALIIPKPGDTSRYYIFTADASENNFALGYRYSEVDVNLNGGLGDVTANKNIPLYAPSTEKLAAVRHANGIDIWVLTREYGSKKYKVFLVTCNGVNTNPVISDVGTVLQDPTGLSGIGQMKVSPNSNKVAAAINSPGLIELFDFNNSTGVLSNPIFITGFPPPDVQGVYGTEFSPNSQVLYATYKATDVLYQFNISSNNQTAINASKIIIPNPYSVAALQLGPDQKIYIDNPGWTYISVIANPDNYGSGSNYLPLAISLNGRQSYGGLPGFIAGYNYQINSSNWTADFNSTFVNCSVEFSGLSNFADMKWYWDFGDNTIDSGQLVRHSYRMSGNYNVTMKAFFVTTCGNRLDSIIVTKPVVINNVLAVDFNYNGVCNNDLYQLNDNTVLTVGNVTGWDWDFDDGNYSVLQNPVHTFNTAGVYNVKFVVSTSGICRADSITRLVYVDSKPVVDFTLNNGCVNQLINFNDLSSNNIGGITNWSWNFNDSYTSNLQNPTHSYANYGNYNVSLTATSLHGCASSASKPLIIDSKPVVDFSVNNGCVNQPVNFNDLSANTLGNIISWQWNFGDNNNSASQNPSHPYTNYGNYNVTLTANSLHGCSSSIVKPLIIESKPIADFKFDKDCPETPILFSDLSTISLGTINGWQWSFGDNNNSTIQNPSHIYNGEGNFPVKLTVSSVYGCVSDPHITTLPVKYIHADAGADALAIYNRPYQLQGNGGVSYLWSPSAFLNDPGVSNPLATLTDDHVFQLKVTSANGCTGYDDVKLTVVKKFDIYVPSGFTPNGDGRNDYLLPICIGIKTLNYFVVYNRWGQVVYTTNDMNGKWDGTFKGAQQPSSIFVWIAKGTTIDGKIIERKGTSTLIR